MDYETLLEAYLSWDWEMVMGSFEAAPGTWPSAQPSSSVPARRLREAMAPIAEHYVWSRKTNDVLAKLGLGLVAAYVYGRAAPLGDVPAEVVVANFAVFEPRLLTAVYGEARRHCGRAGLLAAREEATVESLAEVIGEDDVTDVVTALRRGVEAAAGFGHPMFSGLRSLGWPEHPVGQLWRASDLLREHRFDSHTAVWLAAGLSPVSINLLTELWYEMPLGPYTSMRRGWLGETVPMAIADLEQRGLLADGAITPAGRRLRDEVEERTDAMEQPIIDAIGDHLEPTIRTLDRWSIRLVERGEFPPGTYTPVSG